MADNRIRVYTIGHSNRSISEFVGLLLAYSISLVIDVRVAPSSKKNPQFNMATLKRSLSENGLSYLHIKELGGMRKPLKDSKNTAWINDSFRGYADHMQTSEFDRAIGRVLALAAKKRTAIMCAEAVPWRCHRSMISDALIAKGADVEHILSATSSRPHALTGFAKVSRGRVTYPSKQGRL
ncbi:MAG: DUF488 domain-containing protein [Candidatus Micrarchaeota archaeon]|nr:DUF488 domain-containing protein [Candidatus Micrarchaeota archaeon]